MSMSIIIYFQIQVTEKYSTAMCKWTVHCAAPKSFGKHDMNEGNVNRPSTGFELVQWTTAPINYLEALLPTRTDNDGHWCDDVCGGCSISNLSSLLRAKLSTNLPPAPPTRETPELDETFSIRQNFVLKFPSRLLPEHQLSRKRSA